MPEHLMFFDGVECPDGSGGDYLAPLWMCKRCDHYSKESTDNTVICTFDDDNEDEE